MKVKRRRRSLPAELPDYAARPTFEDVTFYELATAAPFPCSVLATSTVPVPNPGYHLNPIKRGVLGELSKLREELDELQDAAEQGVKVMMLVELSDLLGAMDAYLEHNFPGISIDDLRDMSFVTKRAFTNGHRKPR